MNKEEVWTKQCLGCLCNLRSQSYYFTTCLVVIISLRDEISDVSIAHLYLSPIPSITLDY